MACYLAPHWGQYGPKTNSTNLASLFPNFDKKSHKTWIGSLNIKK